MAHLLLQVLSVVLLALLKSGVVPQKHWLFVDTIVSHNYVSSHISSPGQTRQMKTGLTFQR
jgi:hypothetical protein